jgi:hypothetical protein
MNLDDALTAWAAEVSLPDTAADAIYRHISATPAARPQGLDPRWWQQFSRQLATGIVSSTRPIVRAA